MKQLTIKVLKELRTMSIILIGDGEKKAKLPLLFFICDSDAVTFFNIFIVAFKFRQELCWSTVLK
jgi:hypothetical protein